VARTTANKPIVPRVSPELKAQTAFATREPPTVATERSVVVSIANVIYGFAGLLDGRYWARTSDPQLVDPARRSHLFAQLRLERMVEGKQLASEHLGELERTLSVAIVATRSQMSGERPGAPNSAYVELLTEHP
jgi:hypothetical protein